MELELPKMNHDRLWAAIDALAMRNGLSPSGLARRAGLDATAFNKSKRFTGDGRPRWPSTESIAKILDATGADLDELVRLIGGGDDRLPMARGPSFLDLDRTTLGFCDDEARARIPVWPDVGPGAALQAVQVGSERMLPLYRPGDVLIVSSEAEIRCGDRVVVRYGDGPLEARIFRGRDEATVELEPPTGGPPERVDLAVVTRLTRIVWASQ